MHRAVSFLLSMALVLGVAAYGLAEVSRRSQGGSRGLRPLAESILRQLLETPGNWSRTPPELGLCVEGEAGPIPYLLDAAKLNRLQSMSEEELLEALGLEGRHLRITVLVWRQQLGRFTLLAEAGSSLRGAGATVSSPAAVELGGELKQALVEVEVWGG